MRVCWIALSGAWRLSHSAWHGMRGMPYTVWQTLMYAAGRVRGKPQLISPALRVQQPQGEPLREPLPDL